MPYTASWDETLPDGSTAQAGTIDDIFRAIKRDFRERFDDLMGTGAFTADPMRVLHLRLANPRKISAPDGGTIAFRNAADNADNFTISDDGNIGIRGHIVNDLRVLTSRSFLYDEGSGNAYAATFRQANTAAHVLAMGYKFSATAGGYASSTGVNTARSAVALHAGYIDFFADAASTVAAGTDMTPTRRLRLSDTGIFSVPVQAPNFGRKNAAASATVTPTGTRPSPGTTFDWSAVTALGTNSVIEIRASAAVDDGLDYYVTINAPTAANLRAMAGLGAGQGSATFWFRFVNLSTASSVTFNVRGGGTGWAPNAPTSLALTARSSTFYRCEAHWNSADNVYINLSFIGGWTSAELFGVTSLVT